MIDRVNIYELSATLAHQSLINEVNNPLFDDFLLYEHEDDLYNFDNQGNRRYKEPCQAIFKHK